MTDSLKAGRGLSGTVNSFAELVIRQHKPGWLISITWQIAIYTFYNDCDITFEASNSAIDQLFVDIADALVLTT